jgi:membrane protein YdbS with pleckstrin-like domain
MDKQHIFDKPKNVTRLLVFFYAILVILLAIDFFIDKHPHFAWEAWPQFFAVYGFVACVLLVLVSKYVLRPLVKRKEDYYD